MAAAGVVFAEQGRDAQMDDVARRAGVGVGTVYRHFPTKEALIEALAIDRFEKILAAGKEALLNPDPWAAFAGAIWAGAELTASDRSFTEIVGELSGPMPLPEALEREMRETYGELMRRAQDVGRAARRPRVRRHPDVHVRHRHGRAQDAPVPRRLEAPRLDRDRRPAGRPAPRHRSRTPAAPSLWGYDPRDRHGSRSARGRVGPLRPDRRRRRRRRPGRCRRAAGRRADARRRVRRLLCRKGRLARRSRARRRHAGARRDRGDRRPRRHLRAPVVLRRHREPRLRRAAAARRGEGHRDRDRAAVLPPRVGGAGRRARRGAARDRRAGLRPPPPRDGAPLPAAPAQRGRRRRSSPRRRSAGARRGCGCSRSRRRRSPSTSRRRPSPWRSTSRSRACSTATAPCARRPPRP